MRGKLSKDPFGDYYTAARTKIGLNCLSELSENLTGLDVSEESTQSKLHIKSEDFCTMI